jgi:hypothetical protein
VLVLGINKLAVAFANAGLIGHMEEAQPRLIRFRLLFGSPYRSPILWTGAEELKLKSLWPVASNEQILSVLCRHAWHAIRIRAYRVGAKRRKLFTCLNELRQEVRKRAREDGIPLRKLGTEIGHSTYFLKTQTKVADLNKIAKAVEFFGGRLVIDWQDE